MFVDTFIRRPILSGVCSLVIMLAGVLAIPNMPIAWYPEVAPPTVSVTAIYTGANAETVETAVTTPLEQAINGVEGMLYMSSSSTNSGVSQITVTFDVTRNPDIAAVDVQNRVNQARRPAACRGPSARCDRAEGQSELRVGAGCVLGAWRVRRALRLELHRRLHQGRAQTRARRRRRAGLRRAQVLDARLARPDSAGGAPAHGRRRRRRAAGTERQRGGWQCGRRAGTRGADVSDQRARCRTPSREPRLRERHRQGQRRTARSSASADVGRRRARRRNVFLAASLPRRRCRRLRRAGAAHRQRARRSAGRGGGDGAPERVVSSWTRISHRVRYDHRRSGVDCRSRRDDRHRRGARRAGDVRVSPELARNADSHADACRSRSSARSRS